MNFNCYYENGHFLPRGIIALSFHWYYLNKRMNEYKREENDRKRINLCNEYVHKREKSFGFPSDRIKDNYSNQALPTVVKCCRFVERNYSHKGKDHENDI